MLARAFVAGMGAAFMFVAGGALATAALYVGVTRSAKRHLRRAEAITGMIDRMFNASGD